MGIAVFFIHSYEQPPLGKKGQKNLRLAEKVAAHTYFYRVSGRKGQTKKRNK